MPRKYLATNTVIREVVQSKFDDAYPLEAYVDTYDGYGENPTILSKFGIEQTNEITLTISKDDYLVIDCFSQLNPNDYGRVWNDSFLKKYTTALLKRQWGQNLLKFQGVKLPGGVELNGRQIYDDAEKDLEIIREQMSNTYELPPLDMIG